MLRLARIMGTNGARFRAIESYDVEDRRGCPPRRGCPSQYLNHVYNDNGWSLGRTQIALYSRVDMRDGCMQLIK